MFLCQSPYKLQKFRNYICIDIVNKPTEDRCKGSLCRLVICKPNALIVSNSAASYLMKLLKDLSVRCYFATRFQSYRTNNV